MKSILKQVYGVELSAQKVELALVDDINKLSESVKKISKELNSEIQKFKKAKLDLKNSIKGTTQQSIDLLTKIKDAEKISKELGLKFDDSKYRNVLDDYYKATNEIDNIFQ